jgi:hypothetical protein
MAPDQLQDPTIADPSGHPGHQGVVLYAVEEPAEIDIDNPGPAGRKPKLRSEK